MLRTEFPETYRFSDIMKQKSEVGWCGCHDREQYLLPDDF